MRLRTLAAIVVCGTFVHAQTVVFTGTEGSNSGSPTRDAYTNCATSCVSGVWQPVNGGGVSNGQLACTSVSQGDCTPRSVVLATISGTGVTSLSNGLGAGGVDSLKNLSTVYGLASAGDCGSALTIASTVVPGLTLPFAVVNGRATFIGTTASSLHDTSLLAPTKWAIPGGDVALDYVWNACETITGSAGAGVHDEMDLNHTLSNDFYFGPGVHYNFPLNEWDYCGQGCSGWKKMKLISGGVDVTPRWVDSHHLYMEWHEGRTAGCTPSSPSGCYFWYAACFKDYTAGTPMVCGNWQDATTGQTPSAIPVLKSGFTTNQINLQHQIDFNCASCTVTVNSDFRNVVAYWVTLRAPSLSVFVIGDE